MIGLYTPLCIVASHACSRVSATYVQRWDEVFWLMIHMGRALMSFMHGCIGIAHDRLRYTYSEVECLAASEQVAYSLYIYM